MNHNQYEEAIKTQHEILNRLNDEATTQEDRQKLEAWNTQLSGQLLSIWFPFNWGRRLIMAGLFLLGLYGLTSGQFYFLFAWLGAAIFSPRLMGELTFLVGKASR